MQSACVKGHTTSGGSLYQDKARNEEVIIGR